MKHPSGLGQFDVIILSHVLNVFAPETRAEIVNRLTDALTPDGVLMLGSGEVLPEQCDTLTQREHVVRRASAAAKTVAA